MIRNGKRQPLRLGLLGAGRIGEERLAAVKGSDLGSIEIVFDPLNGRRVAEDYGIRAAGSVAELLNADLDGVIIASPNRYHLYQSAQALRRGLAVFCEKPLASTWRESLQVVDLARSADALLSVDFSYRFVEGLRESRRLVLAGELGRIEAVDLVFHNSGPGKKWFYNPMISLGGCLLDLGIHLVDLALWILDCRSLVQARTYVRRRAGGLDEYVTARIELEGGVVVRLTCSWLLAQGNKAHDAVVEATFVGTMSTITTRNVGNTPLLFETTRWRGQHAEVIYRTTKDWRAGALFEWMRKLGAGSGFDEEEGKDLIAVAKMVEDIYAGQANLTHVQVGAGNRPDLPRGLLPAPAEP